MKTKMKKALALVFRSLKAWDTMLHEPLVKKEEPPIVPQRNENWEFTSRLVEEMSGELRIPLWDVFEKLPPIPIGGGALWFTLHIKGLNVVSESGVYRVTVIAEVSSSGALGQWVMKRVNLDHDSLNYGVSEVTFGVGVSLPPSVFHPDYSAHTQQEEFVPDPNHIPPTSLRDLYLTGKKCPQLARSVKTNKLTLG